MAIDRAKEPAGEPQSLGKTGSATIAPPAAGVEETTPASRRNRTFASLQERDFRLLWLGMLPGTLAMQMGMVTNGFLAYDITGSAAAVGYVTLGFGIPMLFLSLIGGIVADRFSKRQILLMTQTTVGIAAAILAVLVLTDVITIWQMTLVALMMGTAFAFNMPARQAFVAELVSRKNLTNAIALNSSGMNLSRVAGPALAGVLIGVPFIGIGGVYVLMVGMYAFVVYSLVRLPDRGAAEGSRDRSGLNSLLDGLKYIRGNSVVMALMLLAFAPVIFGMSYQALMPVFAEDVFGVGATGLGLLMMVNGLGALTGSLSIASIGDFPRRGLVQIGLGVLFGASLATFSFAQNLYISVPALFVIGGASAAYLALNMSLVMDYTDRAYHGRVMSINMLTFALMPLSVVPTGILVDMFSAPVVLGISGLILLSVVSLYGALHPSYRYVK